MRKQLYISLLAAILALPLLIKAQDTVVSDSVDVSRYRDIETSDVVSDDSVPTWYVEPVIPEELRSPMRATASGCLTDSILTFNADSVLTETTIYEYDAANHPIRTIVWKYDVTGSILSTSSKQEYAYDASGTQIYTGTFAWDTNTNDWRGTAKSEYVYNEAHKMESNITYTWVNNTWLPSQALTYAYDAAGRETEFTTYARNASLNRLVPSKQRLQTWYNASKKTQEINYTAYANGAWSAGTRKDYQYDAKGNQIEYTYYSSYSGGNWVGSTHEIWTYNASNNKTYYKKETWSNNAWAVSNEEFTGYDAAGNTILIENYALKSGVLSGSKKEEYTFNAAKKKTSTITYKWTNGEWVYNIWNVSGYDAAGNANETCKYNWKNNAWVGTGNRTLKTYNSSKKITEQITQSWSTTANDWINVSRATTEYSGAKKTQEASFTWLNDTWVGTSRKDYHYNSAGRNDTTKTYTNNGTDWVYSARTINSYDSRGNTILTHNATWNETSWVMTSMSKLDVIFDAAGHQLLNATYTCNADSIWRGVQKDTTAYTASGKTLYTARYTSWVNNDWGLSYYIDYVYDEAERVILNQRYDMINNRLQGLFRYEYVFNEQGKQVAYVYYSGWNTSTDSWVGSSKEEYVYNANGQYDLRIMYTWRNNQWTPLFHYSYIYDSSNREIEQIVQTYTNESWRNTNRYVKEYKGSRQVKTNDYVWMNDTWIFSSRNETYYDDDSQAKLRRQVTGTWNSGVEQSFTDNLYFYSCDAPADNNGAQPRTPTELEEIDENYDTNVQPFDPMLPTYNLQGQGVDPTTYHGIVIQNGKKYVL